MKIKILLSEDCSCLSYPAYVFLSTGSSRYVEVISSLTQVHLLTCLRKLINSELHLFAHVLLLWESVSFSCTICLAEYKDLIFSFFLIFHSTEIRIITASQFSIDVHSFNPTFASVPSW